MKILFISTEVWSSYNPEGIVARKILNGFLENKYDVDVITTNDIEDFNAIVIKNDMPEIVEKVIKNIIGLEKLLFIYKTCNYLNKINLNKYDLIVTRSEPISTHILGLLLKGNFKLVAMFSDVGYLSPYYGKINFIKQKVSCFLEKKIFEKYDLITHTNQTVINNYAKQGFIKEKMNIFPNPLEIVSHNNVNNKDRNNSEIKIAYIGSLYGNRTPNKLFEYLSQQKSKYKLYLIGAVRNMYYEGRFGKIGNYLKNRELNHLNKLIKEYSLDKNIEILPFMSKKELNSFIKKDINILVNIDAKSDENMFLSSKIVDYLQYNLPILNISSPGATVDFLSSVGIEKYLDHNMNSFVSIEEIIAGKDFVPNPKKITAYLSKEICKKLVEKVK